MTNFIICYHFRYYFFYTFNLLLPIKTILLCFFFFFLIVFKSVLTIPLLIENTRLRITLAIPTGALVTEKNEAIETLPLVELIKFYRNN